MGKIGRYKTPKEFKDEDIWFRWFTKNQFVYFSISCVLAFVVFGFLEKLHLTLIGAMIAIILIFLGFVIPRFDMPADKYLLGGGMPLEQIVIRIFVKKFINKKEIYVRDFTKENQGMLED